MMLKERTGSSELVSESQWSVTDEAVTSDTERPVGGWGIAEDEQGIRRNGRRGMGRKNRRDEM